jgi:protein kinase-like protein
MEPVARSAVEPLSIAVGTAIGDYVIEERVGQGSEGEVFLARDVLLGRRVALKTLRAGTVEATHGVEEARMMAGIEHPHVVRVYHAERHRGIWAVIFEYVDGGSLHSLVQRMGPLPAARALELVAEAAAGLACVHESQIVHRDVKPQNLLLSRHGEVKVGDFGLAMSLKSNGSPASHGVGTPAFLAPELWANGAYSPASDIYSLGACLFFLLTGRVPFPFNNLEQLERAHLKLRPKVPSDVPNGVKQILLAMMAKDPAARPTSDAQLSRELLELSREPHRQRRISLPARARDLPSPFVPGGLEEALPFTLGRGPDALVLDQLIGLLLGEPGGIHLAAEQAGDAERLLGVAIERCYPRPAVVARLALPTPDAKLATLLRKRSDVSPTASIAEALEQLPKLGPLDAPQRRVIEIRATSALGAAQVLEIGALVAEAARLEIRTVLLAPVSGTTDIASPEGCRLVRVPTAAKPWSGFVSRVRLWTDTATGERWDFSVDALRLLRDLCRQHGQGWPDLTQSSISIAATARLPLVTSWAVQAAHLQIKGPLAGAELPLEWRVAPRCWPSPELQARLAELRGELEQELAVGGHCKDPSWARPTRTVREASPL